jgi:hypothetical protein
MREKALIKETGQILDIKENWMKSQVTSSFSFDDLETKEFKNKSLGRFYVSLGRFYVLSDGIEYPEDELIIGTDNIREFKLKGIV